MRAPGPDLPLLECLGLLWLSAQGGADIRVYVHVPSVRQVILLVPRLVNTSWLPVQGVVKALQNLNELILRECRNWREDLRL